MKGKIALELKNRRTGERQDLPADTALNKLIA